MNSNVMQQVYDFDDQGRSAAEYWAVAKRRRLHMLLPAALVFFLGVVIALSLPAIYRSSATILIEEQEIPRDLVRSTVTSFAAQQIQVITQRVMTADHIEKVVSKYGLYGQNDAESRLPRSELAQLFSQNVKLDLVSADIVDPRSGRAAEATIAFTLAFDDGSASVAQKVTNELVTLYLDTNLRARSDRAASAAEFLAAQSKALNGELLVLEARLADFKALNQGALPELHQFNLSKVERIEREISDIDLRLQQLKRNRIEFSAELLQLNPTAPKVLSTGELVLSDVDNLKAMQSKYRSLILVYTDLHPDVIRLQRDIATLKSQLVEQQNEVLANNPAYVMLDTQIKAIDSESNGLRLRQAQLQRKIIEYESLLKRAPAVEQEYQSITREYNTAQAKYQDLRLKQREAEVSQNLEKDRKGERFTLIEPPSLPLNPQSPNRMAIILLSFLLAVAVGAGSGFLFESIDQAIYGAGQLQKVSTAPVLAVVPYLSNDDDKNSAKKLRVQLLLSGGTVVTLLLLLVHFAYQPLDVWWYSLMSNIGLG